MESVVMKINCVECHKRYNIKNSELEDYNIYWVMGGKMGFAPKLLCPPCTKKWSKIAKLNKKQKMSELAKEITRKVVGK